MAVGRRRTGCCKAGVVLSVQAALLCAGLPAASASGVDDPGGAVGQLRTVALDGLYGAVLGLAVGGGILLVESTHEDLDAIWAETLSISTGIGLLLGLAVGTFDVLAPFASRHGAPPAAADPGPAAPGGGSLIRPAGYAPVFPRPRMAANRLQRLPGARPPAPVLLTVPLLSW